MSQLSKELLERREKNIPHGPFNTTLAFIKDAKGASMVDVEGKRFIDFAGGIGVNNVGHSHPKVVQAIRIRPTLSFTPVFMLPCMNPMSSLQKN